MTKQFIRNMSTEEWQFFFNIFQPDYKFSEHRFNIGEYVKISPLLIEHDIDFDAPLKIIGYRTDTISGDHDYFEYKLNRKFKLPDTFGKIRDQDTFCENLVYQDSECIRMNREKKLRRIFNS